MADDIEIRIGASTGGLEAAVDRARGKIESLVAAARLGQSTMASLAAQGDAAAGSLQAAAKDAIPGQEGAASARQALAAQMAQLQGYVRLSQLAYAGEVQHITAAARVGAITEAEKTQALRAALDERFALEQKYYQQELAAAAGNAAQHQRVEASFTLAYQRYLNERQRLDDQALQTAVRDWQAALAPIEAAWDSQLRGLLSGTTNFANAMRSIVQQLVIDIIKEFEKAALAKAALGLANLGLDIGSGGLGGALFSGVSKLLGFDTGAWSIPADMPAMVHAGEMIIPAGAADQFRAVLSGAGGAGGGAAGANVTFQVQAMDSASVAQFFRSNAAQLARTLAAHLNSNPTARPDY